MYSIHCLIFFPPLSLSPFFCRQLKSLKTKQHDYCPHERVCLEWDPLLLRRHKQDAFVEEKKYVTNSVHQQQIGTWDGRMKQSYQRSDEAKYLQSERSEGGGGFLTK